MIPRQPPLAHSVLRLIWGERRISRAEIARQTNLSRSTVSEIVTSLLPTGLVAEVGEGESKGGRPPIVLEFQDEAFVLLGIDIGAAHVSVVLTDLRERVLAFEHRSYSVRSDPTGTIALAVDLCNRCLGSADRRASELVGIGVAVPSPVDPERPDRLSSVVVPDWAGYSITDAIGEHFAVPILIDNDANLGALAERWWGAGRGVDNFAFIKLATGIGAGHILKGNIYRGATGVAGEIGHMAIDPYGGPCVCGLRGCLATFVGSEAILARIETLREHHPESILAGNAELTILSFEDAALADDPLAMRVVTETAEYLGIAIAGMLNLLNPAMVVIGGSLARLGDRLLDPLRDTIHNRTLVSSVAAAQIRASELGPQSVAVGAATLILDRSLSDPSLFPATT